MSELNEKDRWRELAELLGLPADEHQAQAGLPPAAPPFVPPTPPVPPQKSEPSWQSELPVAEPVTEEAFEPVRAEEGPRNEPAIADRKADQDSSQDRRGRGRGRGRRGQRNDPMDRNNREPEPAAKVEDASAEPLGMDKEAAEPRREQERGDRGRGGRGGRHNSGGSRQRDFVEDEPLEPEEAELPVHVPEEDDDEEIDKLTDWSVPSWNDLIGSLYRPER